MGLDMMVYRTSEHIQDYVDFDEPEDAEEVFYWRKHPNLHGWMEKLYYEKDGEDQEFSGPVTLTKKETSRFRKVFMNDIK